MTPYDKIGSIGSSVTVTPVNHLGPTCQSFSSTSVCAYLYSSMTTKIEIKLSRMSYPNVDSCTGRDVATLANL